MTTTLDLPELLLQKARLVASQRRMTLESLVSQTLQRELGLGNNHPSSRRMTRPPVSLAQAPVVPALTNAEIASLMNEEELSRLVDS